MRACLRALCIRRPAVDGGVFVSRKYVTLDKRRVMLASWISNAKQEATETWKDAATCGTVRYRLASPPLFTHCCHCRWCQRQAGSACVVNAMIETDRIQLLTGQPEMISIPSPSGMGQTVARCPTCKIALWSSYTIAGDKIRFVRAFTLDDSDALPPQLHIFTKYRQPWMVLPPNTPSVPEFYRTADYWPAESIARWGDARW